MMASALVCLALTIYMESRGEPLHGQLAVASVVLNRVSSNDSDVCTEVVRPAQFPWAQRKLRRDSDGNVFVASRLPSGDTWNTSVRIAADLLSGREPRIPHVEFFHARWVNPGWQLPFAFAIGGHVFYLGEAMPQRIAGDIARRDSPVEPVAPATLPGWLALPVVADGGWVAFVGAPPT